jgi:soluble P-type ATPase
MLQFSVPGRDVYDIDHLILDYNGTIAEDGRLISGVADRIRALSTELTVHVITADTHGTARTQLALLPCTVMVISEANQDRQKRDYLDGLGRNHAVAIGNGANDCLMLQHAAFSICVIQTEGAAAGALQAAAMVCTDISHALALLLHPRRVTATLRNA